MRWPYRARRNGSANSGRVLWNPKAAACWLSKNGPFARDPLIGYRIQVDGLHVQLAPGRYWLNVAPVGIGHSYVSATRGGNAIGKPPGENSRAFLLGPAPGSFVQAGHPGAVGQGGIATHFSQGAIIASPPK